MSLNLNPQVLERGRYIAQSVVYDYQLEGKLLPAGTTQVLDLYLAKAEECMKLCIEGLDDTTASATRGPAPVEVRLDYANEVVAWIAVSVQLLAHTFKSGNAQVQPCIDVLRRGYEPPLRFNDAEHQLFNSYQRMLKLVATFVDSMPLRSVPKLDEFSPFERDRAFVTECALTLAAQACDLILMLMHSIRREHSLPGKALWQSKRVACENKLQQLRDDEDQQIAESRGEWRLVQTSVPMGDGTFQEDWNFRPFERRTNAN